ncbi:MAG TPA: HAMP domain-containing sensor histidine kinase [Polyangiaceae bacterium]
MATVLPRPSTAGLLPRTRSFLRLAPLPIEPWLLLLFALTMAAFVTSTILAARQFMAVTSYSLDISTNAMPSVQQLSSTRVQMRRLEGELDRAVLGGTSDLGQVQATTEAIRRAFAAYLSLPFFPTEAELRAPAQIAIDETVQQAEAAAALFEAGRVARARQVVEDDFRRASESADAALWRLVDLNVREAQDRGRRIDGIRMHAIRFSFLLDAIVALTAGILAGLAFAILFRSSRALADRSSELEQFTGRVAHDIRGPLTTISLCLGKVEQSPSLDPAARAHLARAEKGLARAKALVHDLLAFASAAGPPQPGALTRVGPAVRATLDEAADFAREHLVELSTESPHECDVACAPGVLASILSNLVHNAIKYMGDASVRRVVVRARLRGPMVRLEVADTGPGVPPGAERRIFDPFVRADTTGRPGIGLGLATVRRLVHAHGGDVGVTSSPSGSTFWVELPCKAQC